MGTLGLAKLALALAAASGAAIQPPADSLELIAWLQLARERSPSVAAASAAVREAAGLRTAARSGRGPRLEASAIYLRYQDPPSVDLGPAGSFSLLRENGYLAGLQVTQLLYSGGRVSAGIRAAEATQNAANSYLELTDVELSAAVAHAYDDILLARALGEVARQSAAVLREAVRVAEEHHAAGTVARLDVLRAQTRLSSAEAAVRASAVAQVQAAEKLAALVGIDPDSAPPTAGTLQYVEVSANVDLLVSRARSARPDVQALRAEANAHQARATVARASRLPSVSLYAMTLASRPELLTGEERWAWEVLGGVNVNWSFFDSGESAGAAQSAKAAAERAEAQAAQAVDAAVAVVRSQTWELSRTAEDVRAGRENVARAERALEIAQDRYAEGVGIQLEVLEAEADLTQARADLLHSIHAHRSAAIELRRASGIAADAPLPVEGQGDIR